jgi:hypothetical protein
MNFFIKSHIPIKSYIIGCNLSVFHPFGYSIPSNPIINKSNLFPSTSHSFLYNIWFTSLFLIQPFRYFRIIPFNNLSFLNPNNISLDGRRINDDQPFPSLNLIIPPQKQTKYVRGRA